MSTKTTFKRIALVAVAALGLGVLSVAPSSAAVSASTFTVANGTSADAQSDSTTAAVISVSALANDSADTITVTLVAKSQPTAAAATAASRTIPQVRMGILDTATANSSIYARISTAAISGAPSYATLTGDRTGLVESNTSATLPTFAVNASQAAYTGGRFWVQLDSVTAPMYGTYTYTAIVTTYSLAGGTMTTTTASQDVSIVVATPTTLSTTVAASKSVAFMNAGDDTTLNTSDAVVSALATASSTIAATIPVRTYNAAGGAAPESVTVTITGAGTVCNSSVCGSSLVLTGSTGVTNLTVLPNGTAGVGTVSIKTTTVTFTPKTVTFYAKSAKTITATVATPVLKIGSNDSAVAVTAVDANGTAWSGSAYIVASTAADALVAGSATTPVKCTYVAASVKFWCPVTAIATGSATFTVIDASTVALATATSNAVTVSVTNSPATSVKLSFDKASYAPYEKAVIKVTVLDSTGAAKAGATYSNVFATGGISANQAFSGAAVDLTGTSITTEAVNGTDKFAGSKTYVVYMPAQGTVTISAVGGTLFSAAGQVAVTASASVVNSAVDAATDAANEATDAANAATDAALAAADAADAATAAAQDASDAVAALSASVEKLVASLKAQLTSLTNLVIKIQKKVKA